MSEGRKVTIKEFVSNAVPKFNGDAPLTPHLIRNPFIEIVPKTFGFVQIKRRFCPLFVFAAITRLKLRWMYPLIARRA
jgi:hypothetical protein